MSLMKPQIRLLTPQTLVQPKPWCGQRIDLSFTPWAGYQDGHTYNISYHAELDDGTPSGDARFFHATFAEDVDIAILSDKTSGTSTIIEDLAIMGKTYTQFTMNDWDTYFKTNWFTNYDKIILPWQDFNTAKDDGGAYYKTLSETVNNVNRKQVLVNFMSSGGTIQGSPCTTWHSDLRLRNQFRTTSTAWFGDNR